MVVHVLTLVHLDTAPDINLSNVCSSNADVCNSQWQPIKTGADDALWLKISSPQAHTPQTLTLMNKPKLKHTAIFSCNQTGVHHLSEANTGCTKTLLENNATTAD
jgi:hypothetical protein